MAKKSKAERNQALTERRRQLEARQQAAARKEKRTRLTWIAAVATAIAVVIGLVVWGVVSAQKVTDAAKPPNISADNHGVVMYADKVRDGAPTIDVYLDYQCPNCKAFEESYGKQLDELAQAGEIRLVNHTMNFMDGNLQNTGSTRAAIAATCSDWVGPETYAKFNAAIFARQGTHGTDGYSDQALRVDIPAEVGIEGEALTAFQRCYDERTPQPFVDRINDGALRNGITGTPSLLRNGEPVNVLAGTSEEDFKKIMVEGN